MRVNKIFSIILTLFSLVLLVLAILRLNIWGDIKADLAIKDLTALDIFYIMLVLTSLAALIFSFYILAKMVRASFDADVTKWVYYLPIFLILFSALGMVVGIFIEANFIQVGLKQAF